MVKLTNLKKEDFESILLNYSIGQYVSYKHIPKAFENTVYFVKTTKGKFVLKVFEQTKEKDVRNQTKMQEYLAENGNPVPRIIKNNKDKNIYYFKNKLIQIQEFADGKRVTLNDGLIQQYGKTISKIDFDLKKIKMQDFYPWGKEFEFKKMKIYSGKKINLMNEHTKLLKQIRQLNRSKLRKSVVHGDLNLDNTLIYKNKINAIIDFGDSHTGFLITDPTIFVCDEIITKKSFNYKKINLFLREYKKKIKLNTEEKKAMFLFAKLRCIYSMNWCNQMSKKHGSTNEKLKSLFDEYYSKYNLFSRETMQNFIKNIS